jgi:hypothetical protein
MVIGHACFFLTQKTLRMDFVKTLDNIPICAIIGILFTPTIN